MSEQKNGLYIFEGLTQKDIAYFIMMSETLQCDSGTTLMLEGDISDNRAYLIESGSVDIYRHDKKISTLSMLVIFSEKWRS